MALPRPIAMSADAECTEPRKCEEQTRDSCEESLRGAGYVKFPMELGVESDPTNQVWCRPPLTTLGPGTQEVLIGSVVLGFVLIAFAFVRGDRVRVLGWKRVLVAIAIAILGGVAAAVPDAGFPLDRASRELRVGFLAIVGAQLLGTWLAMRALARDGPERDRTRHVVAAALLPFISGVVLAERARITDLVLLVWEWSNVGLRNRGSLLAIHVREVGWPFFVGVGATAAILVAAAVLDAPKERPPIAWPRALLGIALALAARGLVLRPPFGLHMACATLLLVVLAFLARGARLRLLIVAVIALEVALVGSAVRDDIAWVGWEDGVSKRFEYIEHATRFVRFSANLFFADLAFVLLIARGKRAPSPIARTSVDHVRLGVVLAALAAGGAVIGRVYQLVSHEATVDERLVQAAATVDTAFVVRADSYRFGTPALIFVDDKFYSADFDREELWIPAVSRPVVRQVIPVPTLIPRSMTIKTAADRLEPITGRGVRSLAIVRTEQPVTTRLATPFVGPPLRVIPVIFALDRGDFRNPYHGTVYVHVREDEATIWSNRDPRTVGANLTRDPTLAANLVRERCKPSSSSDDPSLIVIIDDETRFETALRVAEILYPDLDLRERGSSEGRCYFSLIGFTSTIPE